MNISDAYKKTTAPRLIRRNSDPEEYKEEQIDGRLIWPKQIDPLTNRPVVQLLRHEVRDSNADAQD